MTLERKLISGGNSKRNNNEDETLSEVNIHDKWNLVQSECNKTQGLGKETHSSR